MENSKKLEHREGSGRQAKGAVRAFDPCPDNDATTSWTRLWPFESISWLMFQVQNRHSNNNYWRDAAKESFETLKWGKKKKKLGLPGGLDRKESAWDVGDPVAFPGSGRSLGEGNGYPLQYSCWDNPMDRGAWWAAVHGVTNSWTQLSNLHFHFFQSGKYRITYGSLKLTVLKAELWNMLDAFGHLISGAYFRMFVKISAFLAHSHMMFSP